MSEILEMTRETLGNYDQIKEFGGEQYKVNRELIIDPDQDQFELHFGFDLPPSSFEQESGKKLSVDEVFTKLYGSDWFVAGLAGAKALNLIHESFEKSGQPKPDIVTELQNSLVFSVLVESFRELFKNSYDAAIDEALKLEREVSQKPQLKIKITFQKNENGKYYAIWNDNGPGWSKLAGKNEVLHQDLFDITKEKHDSTKNTEQGKLGGQGQGMKQMYDQLITNSDPKATITWENGRDGGICIKLGSAETREVLHKVKIEREEKERQDAKAKNTFVLKNDFMDKAKLKREKMLHVKQEKHHGHAGVAVAKPHPLPLYALSSGAASSSEDSTAKESPATSNSSSVTSFSSQESPDTAIESFSQDDSLARDKRGEFKK